MSQPLKNVVVAGASGDLGSTVIKSLLANGNFTVSVLIREASTCTFPADVKVVKTDYSPASLLAALQGQDAVVSTVGAAGVTSQIALIDAAEQAGVKRFIPSEFGHNFESEAAAIDSVVLMPKREVLVYLKEKAAQHPDFTYTPIATGPFLDWAIARNLIPYDVKTRHATVWNGGNVRFSTSLLSTVGSSVAAVLSRPSQTANKHVHIRSITTSGNELLAIFEKITGGAAWTVEHSNSDEALKEGKALLAQGEVMAGAHKLVGSVFFGEKYGGDFESSAHVWNKELGLPEGEDLEGVVRKASDGKLS